MDSARVEIEFKDVEKYTCGNCKKKTTTKPCVKCCALLSEKPPSPDEAWNVKQKNRQKEKDAKLREDALKRLAEERHEKNVRKINQIVIELINKKWVAHSENTKAFGDSPVKALYSLLVKLLPSLETGTELDARIRECAMFYTQAVEIKEFYYDSGLESEDDLVVRLRTSLQISRGDFERSLAVAFQISEDMTRKIFRGVA